MRLTVKRSTVMGVMVLALVALLASGCGSAKPDAPVSAANDELDSQPGAAQVVSVQGAAGGGLLQGAPTPTAGFGPIITAAPSATIDPNAPTATLPPPTATITPTRTPAPTATATVAGTPLPTYNAALMGIQVDPGSQEGFETMLWLAKRLGITWIKLQFRWDLMEPQQGQFSDVYYAYRLYTQRANQEGFKVMISIAKAPAWARATAEEDGPPRDPQLLATFINRLMSDVRVDLYGNSYFAAIEVWNEPNLRREWNGATISGAEYMRLFDVAYQAIRAGEGGHSVTVVTAGLAPTGWDDGVTAVSDRRYLQQMYDAGLNNPAYQNVVIGVHPYGAWNPPDARCCGNSDQGFDDDPTWFFLNNLEDTHAIMQQNGDTRLMWVTEFGWPTYDGLVLPTGEPAPPPDVPYFTYIDETAQANYVMRGFEIGQSLPYVGTMILWNLNFSNTDYVVQRDERAGYAILRNGEASDPLRPAFLLLESAPKR